MKFVVVDPGADWSTKDVYDGLVDGLRHHGHTVVDYRYGRRMAVFTNALEKTWRDGGKALVKPTPGDAAMFCSELAVTWALRHQPDWMIVVSGMFFHPDALILAKRAGVRTALLFTESPYDYREEARFAPLVDVCWTNERTAVEPLQKANPRTVYLPHAYHPGKHSEAAIAKVLAETDVPAHDVVFVGTAFQERVELLSAVDWSGIDVGLYGMWKTLPKRSSLKRFVRHGVVDNAYTAALYARAKIGLNLFRQSVGIGTFAPRMTGAESMNPRSYELAACGAFHLSDARPEVSEVFGSAVPTFTTAEELRALVQRYLPDDSARAEASAAARDAVRDHSWHARAAQVVADLERLS